MILPLGRRAKLRAKFWHELEVLRIQHVSPRAPMPNEGACLPSLKIVGFGTYPFGTSFSAFAGLWLPARKGPG